MFVVREGLVELVWVLVWGDVYFVGWGMVVWVEVLSGGGVVEGGL